MNAGMRVHGNATPEELAVVIALVSQVGRTVEPDRYADWRRGRIVALREHPASRW